MAELGYDHLVSMESRDAAFFRALPEEAVRHRLLNEDMRHNAIWDMAISREGRVFFSLCAELAESRYVRLYEYLPDENAFRLHFRLEDRVIVQDREIRASKIHTSMAFMEDGRLIMTTHTTSQAPQHPTWVLPASVGGVPRLAPAAVRSGNGDPGKSGDPGPLTRRCMAAPTTRCTACTTAAA